MSLLSPSLIAFLAVVRKSTVLDAAKDLNLTQTAVTQRIKILEASLGVTLFLRSRRGMLLTSDGEALLQYCKASQELEGMAFARLSTSGKAANLSFSISAPSSIIKTRVLPKLGQISKSYPNLKLKLIAADNSDPVDQLKSGKVDLAFLHPTSVGLEMDSKIVKPERYILVGSSSWKKYSLEEVLKKNRIIDFNEEDQLTFNFLAKYKMSKLANRERHFADNTFAICEMLKSGMGYSVLSEEFAAESIKDKSLINLANGKYYELPFAMAWYPRPVMPDYFKNILESLK